MTNTAKDYEGVLIGDDSYKSNSDAVLEQMAKEFLEADAKAKKAAKAAKMLKEQLMELVGEGNLATAGGFQVESKHVVTQRKATEAKTIESYRFSVKYVGEQE